MIWDGLKIETENNGWELIPSHMREGLSNWIEFGIEPGSFLVSVLKNDLFGAILRADSVNRDCLKNYVIFLNNFAPSGCYGSPEIFNEWKKSKGR